MQARTTEAAAPADRDIILTRTFDAPPHLVWRAFTDPAQIVKWWGPNGFTTTTHSMDVRPGGVWRFDMHGPDGRDYPNRIVFDEIVEHERIEYTHAGEEDDAVCFRSIITFEPHEDGTKLTFRMIFRSREERERVGREYGAVEGALQTIARLGEHLDRRAKPNSTPSSRPSAGPCPAMIIALPSKRESIIRRTFSAPRNLVWRGMTTPEFLTRWLSGPDGWKMTTCEEDHRPGGAYRWVWQGDEGEFTMHGVYREVSPPEPGGAGGRVVRTEIYDIPGASGTEPCEQLATLELSEFDNDAGRDPNRTQVTLTLLYPSREVRDASLAAGAGEGMEIGYTRLDDLLAEGAIR